MWDMVIEKAAHATTFGLLFLVTAVGSTMQAVGSVYADADISSHWETIVATAIGQGILFATYIVGLWWQNKREVRNREWDVADREVARKKLEQKVETAVIEQKTDSGMRTRKILEKLDENTRISADAHQAVGQVIEKLAENTEINIKAHDAANKVNEKIAELTKQFMDVKVIASGVAGGVDTASSTLNRVEEKTEEAIDLLKDKR